MKWFIINIKIYNNIYKYTNLQINLFFIPIVSGYDKIQFNFSSTFCEIYAVMY